MITKPCEGGCHCGNLAYVFEMSRPLDQPGLRACQCTFCRAHGARNTSDPDGAMRITVRDSEKVNRYRFGLKTADFLVCKICGVYVGAILEDAGRRWMTVNTNTLSSPIGADAVIAPHDFSAEDAAARIARRKANWTPVTEFKT